MRSRLWLALSLLGGLPACDRQPAAPADTDSPAFTWMNNPDNGNMRIARFEDGFIVCWSDASNGLRACHSTFPLGDGTETDCGPQELLDPMAFQQVGIENLEDFVLSWLHQNAKGRVWVTVRDLNPPGDCLDNKLVAEGWGQVQNTDDDIFGTTDPNANAWRFRADGRLTAPGGTTVQYSGHVRCMYNDAQGKKDFPPVVHVR
jgi:hypothetical protein